MREKKEINIQIGERIRHARERARYTQEQLAEAIEVSPQYVSDLERGVVGIALPTLKRLCTALHVSSDSILFGGMMSEADTAAIAEKCANLTQRQFTLLVEIVDRYIEAVSANE